MWEDVDYSLLPEHIREGFRGYIEEGVPPGRFIRAVLSNDLVGAFGQADEINRARLFDIVQFLYNEAPGSCWGDSETVAKWIHERREERHG